MKSFLSIFNRYFYFSLISLFIQQSIVASSTYFVSELAQNIALGEEISLGLMLFIFSLIIVYIPSSIAAFFLEKAKIQAVKIYLDRFFERYFNQFTHARQKDEISAVVTSESFAIIGSGSYFLFDMISIFLNVLTNLVVLSVVLSREIMGYYLFGFCISCLIVFFTHKIILKTADKAQISTNRYKGVLLSFWDNICLGNQYNRQVFMRVLNHHYFHYLKTNLNSILANSLATNLGMIVMIIPIACYTFDFFQQNRANGAILAVLVATLPRQIMMVQYAYEAIHQAVEFLGLSARFTMLDCYLTEELADENQLLSRIQFDKIQGILNAKNRVDLTAFQTDSFPNVGRITLRGSNGSGKSSLLHYIKQRKGKKVFYLPANSALFFKSTLAKSVSTGEKIYLSFLELLEHCNEMEIILLDEWDANLDEKKRVDLDRLITELSQHKLVVEVRHR